MQVPTLYQFFRHQLQRGLGRHGVAAPDAVDYVSDVLTRFAETRALYGLRDTTGRPLEHVVDMLEQYRRAQGDDRRARDPGRERWIVRHIGEYTLFISGLFRERLQRRGQLGYYVAHGASAFAHCASHELHPGRRRTYHYLHRHFGPISDALHHLRHEQLPLAAPASQATMLAALWRT